ncbi:putative aldose 1-epimerase family protein [Colletotrichum zoysiae]|uniref:Aldose 1-epimerase family protein n=1 Tax=Colletotrichum zoysiae TaxID=1216348 RepID=A0AAD9HA06_9PEZI|nr:putative aldose 1-epimerase family protein [Colletotrichum zoysiae]
MKFLAFVATIFAAAKSVWTRGSPFAVLSALWATDKEGKYIIESEGIRLAFTNHGAAVTNLWINDTHGEEIDIVLGLDHGDDYAKLTSNPYLNGVIGRYAGYLSNASYQVNDVQRKVWPNAHNGTSTLNGGDQGWGRQTWDVAVHINNSITFLLFDRQWNGFPGVFASCLTHTVTPYEWRIAFGVTPLLVAGPINLSQQVFLNLDGFRSSPASPSIMPGGADGNTSLMQAQKLSPSHRLQLPSSGMRFAVDSQGIPTGDLLSNRKGGENDFWSSAKTVLEGRHGLDNIFSVAHRHPEHKMSNPAAILSSTYSGISMSLYTDQDALRVNTWGGSNEVKKLKLGQGGGEIPQHAAISLEMQNWPDSVNHPEWQNRKTIWGADGLYTSFATYKFSVERRS